MIHVDCDDEVNFMNDSFNFDKDSHLSYLASSMYFEYIIVTAIAFHLDLKLVAIFHSKGH